MQRFAVIDTETTWSDRVMSIGVVIADTNSKEVIDSKYYMLAPEYQEGGMYSYELKMPGIKETIIDDRKQILKQISELLKANNVEKILAYNANFDMGHLPELSSFVWCDIMRLAAYRQYNKMIPADTKFCSTGRMKRGYGVEPILRMLSGDDKYHEKHNAYYDAMDELRIVQLLGHSLDTYNDAVLKR